MKQCSTCKEHKPFSEFYMRKQRPASQCKVCHSAWARANRERVREHNRRYALANPGKLAAARARHYPASYARQKAKRAAERKPRVLLGRAESLRRYYAKNKAKWVAARDTRLAALTAAMPRWANLFFIEEAYLLATLRTRLTGIKWEVDHEVPLVHPLVCGLHVEHNLRVIPALENRRKGNRFWLDMPCST